MHTTLFCMLVVIFVATVVRSTFGFGEALVAIPVLALFVPLRVAAPLVGLISTTIAGVIVVQDWRRIHWRSAVWLLVPTLFGIPLGISLLAAAHHAIVKASLALVIMSFSGYFLWGAAAPALKKDSRAWLLGCGFVAGILGGAYGMNGPPLVIYGAMRRWSPQHFRATLQGYFLPASAVTVAGYWMTGLWTSTVTHDYAISLVAVIPAILLGRWLNHRLRGEAFLRYVHGGLIVVASVLLIQAIHG